ncbi:DNA replication/repair protein RecF [Natronospora cellulosivora (SeqCode)]
MYLEKINLINYRNIENAFLEFSPNLNIMLGNNGQGKTNLLESIYLMATASSHRSNTDKDLINWDKDKALIQLLLIKKDYSLKLALKLEGSNKKIEINNNPIEKIAEWIGNLNVVLFSPEDLYLVKGGPSNRRDFINTEVSQVSSYYYHLLHNYRRVLKQRNNFLKTLREKRSKNYDILEVWDDKLVEIGSKIIKKRLEVIDKLQILARLNHRRITNGSENLILEYESSFSLKLDKEEIPLIFRKDLANNRDREIRRGYTLYGPHRDDLILKVNKIDLRKYGSQGQQRTAALALKLAELEFMKSETGEYPVLLLDDVFSELDSSRRNMLIDLIADKIQTFITATDINIIGKLANCNYKIFEVNEGNINLRS